ncbi:N-alpha-acetyltransferase 40 [Lingula anatina]|uniref:N-alpha-acetyltransferase 40 n=1 Tax=Lingula anatina TaxID=7574 RepID=A0A1S3J8M6_LINAN|nr:N-alpha-acetyltransferase 40 [Lingula anatina]|eukprot:XP_013406663.1 N-alpha-acetyltransferase 40 [Lingula anatina]
MGRKSNKESSKAKEKRLKRKEESSRIAASQAVCDAANKLEDPMATLQPFKTFDRNGLKVTIECKRVTDLDRDTIDWAFQLTKDNMQKMYEDSDWGWNDKDKRDELTDEAAWYLLARTDDNKPVAFIHFRFDLEEEVEVLYCYEIHLNKEVRRKGLGKFMMQILELMAFKTQMKKVMMTVLKMNEGGQNFFVKTLKYAKDEISPDDTLFEEPFAYDILSKPVGQRKPLQQQSQQQASASAVAAS